MRRFFLRELFCKVKLFKGRSRFLSYGILIFLFLFFGILIAINIPIVQTFVARKFLETLNKRYGTLLLIKKANIGFFGGIYLYDVKAMDDHKKTFIYIPKLKANLNLSELILSKDQINLKSLKIDTPKINVTTYYREKKSNLDQFIEKFSKHDTPPSKTIFKGKIEIENGALVVWDQNLNPKDRKIAQIANVTVKLEDLIIQGEDLAAERCSLQGSGEYHGNAFRLNHFSTKANFTSKSLKLQNIDIKTSRSSIKGSLSLKYDKIEDFNDFDKKVHIESKILPGSTLGFKDVNLFTNHWDTNSRIGISGKISGKLAEELILTDVQLQGEGNEIKSDEIKLFKITSLKNYLITQKKGLIRTSYDGLQKLLPNHLAKKIPNFIKNYGKLSLYGGLSISFEKIKTESVISGERVGSLYAKVALDNYTGDQIRYKGKVSGKRLHMAPITGDQNLQFISGSLDFDGAFLSLKDLQIKVKGVLSEAMLCNGFLRNISIDGTLGASSFDGRVNISDFKGKVAFDGKLNFSQKNPALKAKISIQDLNLSEFGLIKKQKALISTQAQVQISGADMTQLEGTIAMYQSSYEADGKKFKSPKIEIQGIKEGEKRKLTLEASKMFHGEITGNSPWNIWPKLLKNALQRLTNEQGKNTFKKESYLAFHFKIESAITELFGEKISFLSTNEFRGKIGPGSDMKLDFHIQKAQFKDVIFQNVQLTSDETTGQYLQLKIDKLTLKGTVLKDIALSSFPQGKLLKISSSFIAEWKGKEHRVELNLCKQGNWSGKERHFSIGLQRSKVLINGHNWWINEKNDPQTHKVDINLNKGEYRTDLIVLSSFEGQCLEFSFDFKKKKYKHIRGKLQDIQLKRLLPQENQDKVIDGLVNGYFSIESFDNLIKPKIKLSVDRISSGNTIFGNLKVTSSYDEKNKNYLLKGQIENKGIKIFHLAGVIKNHKKAQLDLNLTAEKLPLALFEPFLDDVFSNIRGTAKGEVKIAGSFEHPVYQGALRLQQAGMKVNYLNTQYELMGQPVVAIFTNSIEFENFSFKDPQYNTQAYVKVGKLYKKQLKWNVDLSIESHHMLLLNTSSIQNNFFYGTLFASAINRENKTSSKPLVIGISGETNNLKIQVKNARITNLSQLSINTQGNKTTEKAPAYIYFLNTPKSIIENPTQNARDISIENNKNKGISIDIETLVDSEVQIKLIMDEYADNFINAKGKGIMRLKMEPDGDLQMAGSKYEVSKGIYQFSNEQIPFVKLDKKFDIRPGGTILWNGSPMSATLDIQAFYRKTVSNVAEYIKLKDAANFSNLTTELNIYISGELLNPEVTFEIKFPDAPENIRQQLAEQLNTKDEILTQFGSILLLGKFFLDNKNIIRESGWSLSADIALKQLGNILSSLHNSLNVNFEYVQGNPQANAFNSFRSSISYEINKRFNLRATLGVPLNTTPLNPTRKERKNAFTGDIQLSIDISKFADRSLTLTLFSRPSTFGQEKEELQPATFSSQTNGTGIIHTTQFDNFKEFRQKLFSNKKGKVFSERKP